MATFSSPIPLGAEGAGQDLYALLDVDHSVGVEDLRLAYRRAIRRAHPDKGGSSEAFLAVVRAFDVLSNPATRVSYDQELATETLQKRIGKRSREKKRGCEAVHSQSTSIECRLQEKLSNLREVLQSMDASTRRTSISNMSSKIRVVLMKHMEGSEDSPADQVDRSSRKLGSSSIRLRAVAKGTTGGTAGCKYSAQMDIDCLRTYTRQVAFDLAIEHQLVLSDLRDKLVAASEMNASIWSPPYKVCDIFHQVLLSHQTCAKELGLSVFVQLRASEWVANRHSLTSAVLSFEDAVALRFRLISARTWPALRQEWLQLLQSGRHKLEETSAVALVDAARMDFLQRKFQTVVKQVEEMLETDKTAEPTRNTHTVSEVVHIHLSAEILKRHTAVQERKRESLAANSEEHCELR